MQTYSLIALYIKRTKYKYNFNLEKLILYLNRKIR